jgi:hypothetical protein
VAFDQANSIFFGREEVFLSARRRRPGSLNTWPPLRLREETLMAKLVKRVEESEVLRRAKESTSATDP